jgi:hypothetical protein
VALALDAGTVAEHAWVGLEPRVPRCGCPGSRSCPRTCRDLGEGGSTEAAAGCKVQMFEGGVNSLFKNL